jgi:hypothetical protein
MQTECLVTEHREHKKIHQKAEGNVGDQCIDFWMYETGTGEQMAQLHVSYMMMIQGLIHLKQEHGISKFVCISSNL